MIHLTKNRAKVIRVFSSIILEVGIESDGRFVVDVVVGLVEFGVAVVADAVEEDKDNLL